MVCCIFWPVANHPSYFAAINLKRFRLFWHVSMSSAESGRLWCLACIFGGFCNIVFDKLPLLYFNVICIKICHSAGLLDVFLMDWSEELCFPLVSFKEVNIWNDEGSQLMIIPLFIILSNLQSMMGPIRFQTFIDSKNIRIYNKKLIKKRL